jgi:hypothetical protein
MELRRTVDPYPPDLTLHLEQNDQLEEEEEEVRELRVRNVKKRVEEIVTRSEHVKEKETRRERGNLLEMGGLQEEAVANANGTVKFGKGVSIRPILLREEVEEGIEIEMNEIKNGTGDAEMKGNGRGIGTEIEKRKRRKRRNGKGIETETARVNVQVATRTRGARGTTGKRTLETRIAMNEVVVGGPRIVTSEIVALARVRGGTRRKVPHPLGDLSNRWQFVEPEKRRRGRKRRGRRKRNDSARVIG